ncbi:MAG TPA: carboxypeptidase-like regulatory domain-containing protein, partial [Longimicrobiales bacterium]|nr:carboxypeptidase-like regulatory domain-containing protein [Longimicrobiales bacterium]
DRARVGGAGARIRLFLDSDGNGRLDAGEEILPGQAVHIHQSLRGFVDDYGVYRTGDLIAYQRYSVDIDPNALGNPLWVPQYDSFSFIAEPNVIRDIDVPFYVAGVVEGRVTDGSEEARGVQGLEVRIVDQAGATVASVETFSDGTFYHMGLRPGRYTARLSTDQLVRLGLRAEPAEVEFSVAATEYGDFVEGLRFVVRPEP